MNFVDEELSDWGEEGKKKIVGMGGKEGAVKRDRGAGWELKWIKSN